MALFVFSGVSEVKAYDAACKLYDAADVFTADEEKSINKKIGRYADDLDINIAVVVADDKDKGSREYADLYYEKLFGINTDGILLFIDVSKDRLHWISTSGSQIKVYKSYIDPMFDDMTSSLRVNDYSDTVDIFLNDLKSYPKKTIFKSLLIGALAGALVSVITAVSVTLKYKRNEKYSPRNYEAKDKTNFTEKNDNFLREYTTKTRIESSSGNGTHRSSGGGTHGGGGRRI